MSRPFGVMGLCVIASVAWGASQAAAASADGASPDSVILALYQEAQDSQAPVTLASSQNQPVRQGVCCAAVGSACKGSRKSSRAWLGTAMLGLMGAGVIFVRKTRGTGNGEGPPGRDPAGDIYGSYKEGGSDTGGSPLRE